MEKAIIGKKIGMSQIFDEAGHVVPVTIIQAGPCTDLTARFLLYSIFADIKADHA